jgi:hypothetical protein
MENLPQLQDIHLAANPSWWPLAIGWWLLISILIFLLAWLFLKLRQHAKLKKQRREILAKLNVLETNLNKSTCNEVVGDINILLRQLAIHYYPRKKIASLTGYNWLQFLDQSGKTSGFSKGAGRILIEAPYQPETASRQDQNFNKEEFFPLIKRWIKTISKNQGNTND